jgi:Lecithin:cholesterol acyltransferase
MKRRSFLRTFAGVVGAAAVSRPRLALAGPREPMRDVIVVLPGITGSVLRKGGQDFWAPSAQGIFNAIRTLGDNLQALKVSDDQVTADDLGDGVTAGQLIPDVHLIPGFWKIDGYTKLVDTIRERFQVELGRNFFPFPYDWRRDNRVAARRLARESHAWLKTWRESSGNRDAKLILVAHSMGGLVSRYFLECLEGWKVTGKLVTFGTPYRGSLNALNFICNGYTKALGPVKLADLTELLRSFTSMYQLLPVYPCYDPGNGQLVRVAEVSKIPNLDASRAAQALAFHREIDERVIENLKNEQYRLNGYKIHPVIGTFQPTLQSARLVAGRVKLSTTFPGQQLDGDGTVPRPSATPRELSPQDSGLFIAEVHGSLQNSDPALVQLSGLLSGQSLKWESFWGPEALSIALLIDDIYASSEPVVVRARHAPPELKLTFQTTVTNTGTLVKRTLAMKQRADGIHEARLGQLPAGTYRVTIRSGTDSVTDVFVVGGA